MIAILHRVNWKHGVKTALAAGICLSLSRVLKLHQGYWACVSTIVVMQSETAATLISSRDRLVGTALGATMGWAGASLWHGNVFAYGLIVLICMLIPPLMGLQGAGRMAGVAATIILLVPSSVGYAVVARDRFLEVSFGIVVALLVSQLLWRQTTVSAKAP